MTVGDAYSATGGAWQAGPGRIYDRLAEVLVAECPGGVQDRRVLDLGAGTGAATKAALAAGASAVVATDVAVGMLRHEADLRPPAVAGDACRLPFAAEAFGAVVAAFSLNHVPDPAVGLAEAARVLVPGGGLVASAYAEDDGHPVKGAVEEACRDAGWVPEPWYEAVRADAMPRLATVDRARAVARVAGLAAEVESVQVPFPGLGPSDLVAWRLGMAQFAPFVAGLAPGRREALTADALRRLGPEAPVLERSIVLVRAEVG